MSIFHRPKPETLSEWLDIATRKLAAAAKARIGSEIEAHFVEAVGEHMQNGLSEPVARMLALEQLGDPKLAARRLRKHHLTEWESQFVQLSAKFARSALGTPVSCGMFLNLALILLFPATKPVVYHVHPLPYWVVEILVMVVLPVACSIRAKRIQRGTDVRLLLLLQSVSGTLVGLGINQLFTPSPYAALFWMDIVMAIFLGARFLAIGAFALLVWNKLETDPGAWRSAPSPDAVQS